MAVNYVRNHAEAQMEDTVRIYRNKPSALNVDNGLIESGQGYVVYEGKARIQNINGPAPMIIGEGDLTFSDTYGSIPVDINGPIPVTDDTLLILTHKTDPDLIGKSFRITGVHGGGYLMAVRTIHLRTLAENRTWVAND
jgi:hypothetical protein